ncbi:MAG: Rieske (2Fe-2S) protein [Deltaproteobacteria bacterium]|nr:MAG: Rieske (2Fe-2S) protein [Deltaproteobacteria bacterium]
MPEEETLNQSEQPREEQGSVLSRRNFLERALKYLNLMGVVALFSGFLAYLIPPRKSIVKVGGWQKVATRDKLKKGVLSTTYFGLPIFLLRRQNDIAAFSAICPHLGCIIKWDGEKREFPCPCHDSSFTIEGKVTGGPARPYNLLEFRVKVEGEDISVEMPEEKLKGYPAWFRNTMISGG